MRDSRTFIPTLIAAFVVCGGLLRAQDASVPRKLTADQRKALADSVRPHLQKTISDAFNSPVSLAETRAEFAKCVWFVQSNPARDNPTCSIEPVSLGKLGWGVLVTDRSRDVGSGMGRSGFLGLYRWRAPRFESEVVTSGAGALVDGPAGIPDMEVVSNTGACGATVMRYRYNAGSFRADACMEQTGSAGEACGERACTGSSLPIFHPKIWGVQ